LKRGYKDTEIGEIPVEWEVKELSDIAQISGGSTPSTSNDDYWNGTIPWATPTDITKLGDGVKYLTNTDSAITEKALKECNLSLFPVESVLMTSRASIGFTAISKYPLTTNQGFCIFHQLKNIHNIYLSYYLESIRPILMKHSSGSTFKEISKSSIKKIKLPLPPLPEQKKVAEILSSVDESVRSTQAVIDQTKTLKQGLLNQLLIKGIGHKKFKQTEIGEIPVEWEVVTIKDVVEKISIPVDVETDKEYREIGIRSHCKGIFYKEPIQGLKLGNKRVFWVKGDCFILNIVFAWEQAIAYTTSEEVGFIVSHRFPMFKPDTSKLYLEFFWRLFFNAQGHTILQEASPGGAGRNRTLNQNVFLDGKIPLPTITEQIKIATILSVVDNTLNKNIERLNVIKKLKSGLMQDLLTGKKRVQYAQS